MKIFETAMKNKGYILKTSLLALLFWVVQFVYQFYLFDPGLFEEGFIRSFALTGATLITLALIIGPLSRLTKINFLEHRRAFGVWGFTFIIMHYLSVMYFYFNFNLAVYQKDPLFNIMLLGTISFWLYLPLYLTSTDWAEEKLGYHKWKIIHRLIYLAYIFSVMHYVLISQYTQVSYSKLLLLCLTVLALALQLAAFVKTIAKTRHVKDAIMGVLIILFGLLAFYAAFVLRLF